MAETEARAEKRRQERAAAYVAQRLEAERRKIESDRAQKLQQQVAEAAAH